MKKLAIVLALLTLAGGVSATDHVMSGCTVAEFNTKLAAAATGTSWNTDGDRIIFPACTATWTSAPNTVTKNISIVGDGIGSTVITVNNSGVTGWMKLGTSKSRLTGFTFLIQAGNSVVTAQGRGFRIDNSRFENTLGNDRLAIYVSGSSPSIPHPDGVIDHNEFYDARIYLQADLALDAATIWSEATKISTSVASSRAEGVLYIENNECEFSFATSNCVDEQYGGRYVVRYNSFINTLVEVHSMQSNDRGSRSWEVYNNTFHSTLGIFTALSLRGATGVAYNNTITGNYGAPITMDNVRSFQNPGGSRGVCDGSSTWDQNTSGQAGWRCRDQIGTDQDNVGTQPTAGQTYTPAYFWNNTNNGAQTNPSVRNNGSAIKTGGSSADIRENFNYFRENTSFNGTVGVGVGVNASRPATCTAQTGSNFGVAYWNSDLSRLDGCSATNTWTAYYAAYTYPHPLVQALAAPTVSAIDPDTGSSSGGTTVTITGTNFVAGMTVEIDGTACGSVNVTSGTTLTCVTGAHAEEAGLTVEVCTPESTPQCDSILNSFAYADAAPTVTGIAPSNCSSAGGCIITVTGTGFLAGAGVTICGYSATSVVIDSSTQITARAGVYTPGHAATCNVVVTNTDTQNGTLSSAFTYNASRTAVSMPVGVKVP